MSKPQTKRQPTDGLSAHFPKEAAVIADIIVAWSSIEDLWGLLLPVFTHMETNQSDLILAQAINSSAKLKIVRTAGEFALKGNVKELAELNDLFNQLEGRLKDRNQYAHSVFVKNQKDKLCPNRLSD